MSMDWFNATTNKKVSKETLSSLKRLVQAGGMARIFEHLLVGQFAIVSASRKNKTDAENVQNTTSLKSMIVSDGLGFYPADGFYSGLSEDSLFIPNATLEKAIAYGRRFEQDEVVYGKDGEYNFFSCSNGKKLYGGIVGADFTILKDEEVKALIDEKSEIGFTDIRRRKQRPWTTDPRIRDWRKEREDKDLEVPEVKVCVISDPIRHMSMGNYHGVYNVAKIDGDWVDFDDERLHAASLSGLMAFFPMEDERA
jgi:hypothetical protein